VVSKPSKESGARARSKTTGGSRSAATPSGSGASAKSGKAKTKKDLEREVAELKKVNAELQEKLRQQEARAERLAQINRQAGERVDTVIGRIRTMLAS